MLRILIILLCCTLSARVAGRQMSGCDSMVYLRNGLASFGINAFGGAITHFGLQGSSLNPFTWALGASDMPANNRQGAPFRGHFLCLGRWGAPTEGEMQAGIPHNGEAGNACWQLLPGSGSLKLTMQVAAPRDGMQVWRTVEMDKKSAAVKVTERVHSTASIIRPFNMVQHATIGPPFLDTSTLVDCNAADGFMQSMSYPNPHTYTYTWPMGIADSLRTPVDLRKSSVQFNYVTTHIFRDSVGWITALNAKSNLLIGYVWLTQAYPWVNVWQQWKDGALWAKGLEFGTTGIGRPYQDLVASDTRFYGRPSFVLLDAGESVEKSFLFFGITVPNDFAGVQVLKMQSGKIWLTERGGKNRILVISTSLSLNQ